MAALAADLEYTQMEAAELAEDRQTVALERLELRQERPTFLEMEAEAGLVIRLELAERAEPAGSQAEEEAAGPAAQPQEAKEAQEETVSASS